MQAELEKALHHPIFKIVAEQSTKLNSPSFVVGGYVRDYFLHRESKDVDFVTLGSGIELAQAVQNEIRGSKLNVYKNFGTAVIHTSEWEFEFVGARKESYRSHSRKPIVEDGSFNDDIGRRDFTINAMAIELSTENYGQLIDHYNGTTDLKNKILRTPLDPNITFSDDPLRMMRAARFASQLNFDIDPIAFEAMKTNADRISIVSQERITDELQKIMASPMPSVGFKILFSTNILQQFFPEFSDLQGVEYKNGKGHKDNFYHTLQVLDKMAVKTQNIWLRWAALMHDIAKPRTKRFYENEGWTFHGHEEKGARMVKGIFRKLKLPLDRKMRYVQNLVRLHLRPIALSKEGITDSAIRRLIFDAGEELDDLITLCRCDITTKNAEKEARFLKNLDRVEEQIKIVEERDRIRNWQPPLDGNKIMEIFGISAGREIGIIKNALKEAILEGEIANNYEDAFRFVVTKGTELGLDIKITNE